ncbi:MAG: DUF429 domain-containing protein, partial [Ignisphaera sp.]|nr:DUF429 domain-containing protein [Ignisphaera sp.]
MCRTLVLKRIYIGIDLAAKESRCSGFAYIVCRDVCRIEESRCMYRDDDILNAIAKLCTDEHSIYISIDAPFSLGIGMRKIDKKMLSMGFRVFPPGFSYMRLLTARAANILNRLRMVGVVNVYETHPRSTIINSGCSSVRELLKRLNIEYNINVDRLNRDLSDAIICAAVSYCIDNGCYIKIE